MSKAGQKMIEGLKEAITMNSLMIENKMLAAELRQADDMALNQALTINKLQAENEKLREALKPFGMCDGEEAFVDMDNLYDVLEAAREALES